MINIYSILNTITISDYGLFIYKIALIVLGVVLIFMILSGLIWYFRKLWSSRDDDSERRKLNNSIKWMVFSWFGLLTIEVILLIIYTQFT